MDSRTTSSLRAATSIRLPSSLDSATAPLIQVLTTVVHAQRRARVAAGQSVAVIGLGVSGQLHVQLAKARGATPVVGVTRSAWKRGVADRLGADLTVPTGEDAIGAVKGATDGRGADVVIESTGMVKSIADAIAMVRPGGTVVLFGIYTATEGALPFYQLYYKEPTVVNARAAMGEDFPESIDLVASGRVRLSPLVHAGPAGDRTGAGARHARKRRRRTNEDHPGELTCRISTTSSIAFRPPARRSRLRGPSWPTPWYPWPLTWTGRPVPEDAFSWDIVDKGSACGLRTLTLMPEYGGAGADCVTTAMVVEELARGDMGVSVVFAQTLKLIQALQGAATEEQRARFLPMVRDDPRCLLAIGMTEPQTSSDYIIPYRPAGFVTSATRKGAGWLINGRKRFISNGNRRAVLPAVRANQPRQGAERR